VQSINTNPSTARAIVKSEAVLQKVAGDVDLPVSTLRKGVSANPLQGNIARLGQTPLIAVAVKGPRRAKVRAAANELARILVSRLSGYSRKKLDTLTRQIDTDRAAVAEIDAALGRANVSSTDKLLLQLRLTQIQQDLTQSLQLRALADDVEAPRIVARAAAQQTTARSRRNSIVVGALIGLILGVIAALIWDALESRVARRPAR
jgi:capsular polysaccharide biosynthesis protein